MSTGLKLDSIFTDGLVFQRGKVLEVYGRAKEGTKVTVEICGQTVSTISNLEGWKVNLSPLKFGGPFSMTVYTNKEEVVVKDILVGDVYIAAGQSNMEFMLKDSLGGEEEIKKANYSQIRFFNVPRIEYEDENVTIPKLEEGKWLSCNFENIKEVSAVAYYFAKNIQRDINIPIGIIGCNKGGTSASCWVSEEYLAKDKGVKEYYLDTYFNEIKNLTMEMENSNIKEYENILTDYNKKVSEYITKYPERSRERLKKDVGHTPWPPPIGRKSFLRPCGLYNTMLKKISGVKAKAVLWYQGEEDTKKAELYEVLLKLLIENWREIFKDEKLPFICVQLPSYNDDKEGHNWPVLREAQLNVSKSVENVELIVAIDCGEEFNIHPVAKATIGERVALMAKEWIYKKDVNGHSPIFKAAEVNGEEIIIYFENSEELSIKGEKIRGLQVSEDGREFIIPEAYIKDENIVIKDSKKIPYRYIRYGWANYTDANIYNKSGLAVCPFNYEI